MNNFVIAKYLGNETTLKTMKMKKINNMILSD